MLIKVKHTAVANTDALEAPVAVKEAVVGNRDLCVSVLDEATIQVVPHGFLSTIEPNGQAASG
jgi:hypothetical protein